MGHNPQLLLKVCHDVEESWPPDDGYEFYFERGLPRMSMRYVPDIYVTDPEGEVCCVVEIGYTQPEKLTYYRSCGISDVRWYDKRGLLHGYVQLECDGDPRAGAPSILVGAEWRAMPRYLGRFEDYHDNIVRRWSQLEKDYAMLRALLYECGEKFGEQPDLPGIDGIELEAAFTVTSDTDSYEDSKRRLAEIRAVQDS